MSGAAHADLRALIEGLTSRLNALADSDDETLDQLSEIVAYIKSNKTLIDAVTTGKVSTSDIVDNLTTNASGKVLSAAQGVALKAMIDGIVIPTALPNPQPITINGQRYDGSESVTVTTVEIDDTLTQSGKAADAKAVGDQLSALNEAIGDLGTLKTTEKSSIVGAMNEVFQFASNGKKLIASAITGKGIDTSEADTFQTMAANISNISGTGNLQNPLTKCGSEKFKFAIFSDTHIQTTDETHNTNVQFVESVSEVQGLGCEFIAITGDVCEAKEHLSIYKTLKENNAVIPVYEIAGNHDASVDGLDTGLWLTCTGKEPYYEVVHYDEVFLFVSQAYWDDDANSKICPTPYQDWIKSKLEEYKTKPRVFFFFHQYMPDCDGFGYRHGDENNSYLTGSVPFFTDLINNYKNVIWFSGHSHTRFGYQKNYPNVLAYNKSGEICTMIHVPTLQDGQYYIVTVYDKLVEIVGYSNGNVVDTVRFVVENYVYVSPIQTVVLDKSTLNFANEEPQTLTATVTPSDYQYLLTWHSSNEGVATVVDGIVTPVGNGDCVITAKCDVKYATCNVNVNISEGVYYSINSTLNGCTLSNAAVRVKEGEPYAATLIVPDSLIVKSVAITMGGVDITSTVYDQNSKTIEISRVTGNVEITVSVDKLVTGLSLNTTSLTLNNTGDTYQLVATKTPSDAVGDITWESSDPNVVTVSNGLVTVTATSSSSCTITAKCGDVTASCVVKVEIRQRTIIYSQPNETTITFANKVQKNIVDGGTTSPKIELGQPMMQGIKYYITCDSFKFEDGTDVNSPVDKIGFRGDSYKEDGTKYGIKICPDYTNIVGVEVLMTTGHSTPLTRDATVAYFQSIYVNVSSSTPVAYPFTVKVKGFKILTYGETI